MFEITDKANAPLVRWKPTTRTTEPDSGATSKQRSYFADASEPHPSTGLSSSSSKLDFESVMFRFRYVTLESKMNL